MSKIFYKKKLYPSEEGLEVFTNKWISIHETECFHFCVDQSSYYLMNVRCDKNETPLQYAKRNKILKRISKENSRFAFDTEGKAIAHLRMLKKKQKRHMERDILFIDKFLKSNLLKVGNGEVVEDSSELVQQHYQFD